MSTRTKATKGTSKAGVYSEARVQSAAAKHQYVKIGDKAGHLVIGGAESHWNGTKKNPAHPRDVYVPALRVVGTPEAILAQFSPEFHAQVQGWINDGYTMNNYKTSAAARFNQELAEYEAWAQANKGKPTKAQIPISHLAYLADKANIAAAQIVTSKGEPKTKAAGGAKTPRGKSLAQRLEALKGADKVIDVSNMTAEGTKAKAVARPTGNSKKVGVAGLAIISSDRNTYAAALAQLGPGREGYLQAWDAAHAAVLSGRPAAAAAPRAVSPRASSPRSGAPVVFRAASPGRLPAALPRAASPRR